MNDANGNSRSNENISRFGDVRIYAGDSAPSAVITLRAR